VHPDKLLDQLSAYQLAEWEAYDRIDPIGEWRTEFRAARLESLIINTARAVHGRRGIKMTAPIDFMPKWDVAEVTTTKKQTTEEMKEFLLTFARTQNRRLENLEKKRGERITKKSVK
jgi:hypothetical protein